jgi:hypothetical protein
MLMLMICREDTQVVLYGRWKNCCVCWGNRLVLVVYVTVESRGRISDDDCAGEGLITALRDDYGSHPQMSRKSTRQ